MMPFRLVPQRQPAPLPQRRFHDMAGGQVVECELYAYVWRGDGELVVGEAVLLPDHWLKRGSVALVTALGSCSQGELVEIVGRLER